MTQRQQLVQQVAPQKSRSQITWAKDTTTGEITPIVIEEDGSTTTITISVQGSLTLIPTLILLGTLILTGCSGTMQKSLIRITRQVSQNTASTLAERMMQRTNQMVKK